MKILLALELFEFAIYWIMDFGWWMLSFKVKFEDFRILFRYSEQVIGYFQLQYDCLGQVTL